MDQQTFHDLQDRDEGNHRERKGIRAGQTRKMYLTRTLAQEGRMAPRKGHKRIDGLQAGPYPMRRRPHREPCPGARPGARTAKSKWMLLKLPRRPSDRGGTPTS